MRPEESIIREAEFDPSVVKYNVAVGTILVLMSIIGIPLAPIILPLIYVLGNKQLERLSCTLTERSVSVRKGILSKIEKTIPLEKITDVAMIEGPLMRMFGVKALSFETAGSSSPGALVRLVGIKDADAFRDAVLTQRDLHTNSTTETTAPAPDQTLTVLTEIRDELRSLNKNLSDK